MGMVKPIFGKSKKFYEKKRAKAIKVKSEQEAIIAVCDEVLNKDKA